jgi:hypothetical protein
MNADPCGSGSTTLERARETGREMEMVTEMNMEMAKTNIAAGRWRYRDMATQ